MLVEYFMKILTYHELGMNIDHKPSVNLCPRVIGPLLWMVRRHIIPLPLNLPVTEAKEVQVITWVCLPFQACLFYCLCNYCVHHLHSQPIKLVAHMLY
jgi:hypothetical protein